MQTDRRRWDDRYREGAYTRRPWPSAILSELADQGILPPARGARALDVACGAGRNSLYLAQLGYRVDAMDVSPVALARAADTAISRGVRVNWQCRDLVAQPPLLVKGQYAVITLIRFMLPEYARLLVPALAPGGLLIVEEHLQWPYSSALAGPQSERFRVAPGDMLDALLTVAPEAQAVHQYEGLREDPDGASVALSQLAARL